MNCVIRARLRGSSGCNRGPAKAESYLVVERKRLVFFTWASIDGAEQVMTQNGSRQLSLAAMTRT